MVAEVFCPAVETALRTQIAFATLHFFVIALMQRAPILERIARAGQTVVEETPRLVALAQRIRTVNAILPTRHATAHPRLADHLGRLVALQATTVEELCQVVGLAQRLQTVSAIVLSCATALLQLVVPLGRHAGHQTTIVVG